MKNFILSGDGVFHTIQGEGNFAGIPTTFIRLNKCNLSCMWCDTPYTWNPKLKEYLEEERSVTIDDIHTLIQQKQSFLKTKCNNLVFTGGEPMIQQIVIAEFCLKYPDYEIQIETNGTIQPIAGFEKKIKQFNISPKLSNSGNKKEVRYKEDILKYYANLENTIFKFVVKDEDDLDEIKNDFPFVPIEKIWIMPEGIHYNEYREVFKKTINKIIQEGYNISLRGQNIYFEPNTRAK